MQKVSFAPQAIGVAVIVSAPQWYSGDLKSIQHTDKVRGDLSLSLLQEAVRSGYKVVVAERGSSPEFIKTLERLKGLHIIERGEAGRSAGKRQVIRYVSKLPGIQVIVVTEPEKVSFISSIPAIVQPIFDGKADLVMPRREDSLFKSSYPLYMYKSEIEANTIYNKALRRAGVLKKTVSDFDWYFGPRVFRNDKGIVSLFMKKYRFTNESLVAKFYNPEEYSNTQYFPIINALLNGYIVADFPIPFVYPETQKANEETGARDVFIAKRKHQQVSLLIDLMHFLRYILKGKN